MSRSTLGGTWFCGGGNEGCAGSVPCRTDGGDVVCGGGGGGCAGSVPCRRSGERPRVWRGQQGRGVGRVGGRRRRLVSARRMSLNRLGRVGRLFALPCWALCFTPPFPPTLATPPPPLLISRGGALRQRRAFLWPSNHCCENMDHAVDIGVSRKKKDSLKNGRISPFFYKIISE